MIVSVSDILQALDKVPEWLGLKRIPSRIEALERRVAALEEALKSPPDEVFPIWRKGRFLVKSVHADPTFSFAGVQQRLMECDACGHTEFRQHQPG